MCFFVFLIKNSGRVGLQTLVLSRIWSTWLSPTTPSFPQSRPTQRPSGHHGRAASPPVLPDELVEEILLRLPPDDPACLLRASVVCKTWGCAVSHPSFRRRIHDLHGTAPVLGFLHEWRDERIPNFVPTTASSFSLAAPDRRFWQALDFRHGRALFLFITKDWGNPEVLVWEPITGAQRRVSVPAAYECSYPNAAVFCCGADACDHRDCHGGPFRVVFVFTISSGSDEYDSDDDEHVLSACVYSSETGTWGELASTHVDHAMDFEHYSSVLVGRSLLYFMSACWLIVEYDWAGHSLRVFEGLEECGMGESCTLMLADDGGLGVNELTEGSNPHLKLWSRDASDSTDERWVLSRDINLEKLLSIGSLAKVAGLLVLGFAEGANVIFMNTAAGLFAIELQSERAKKLCDNHGPCRLIPVVSFYTPVPRNSHQDLPLLKAPEVAGCPEERGEEEKTVDRAQQLFDNGSSAIKEGTSSTPSSVSSMS
uniref:Uncharacterized protein n=1 Tax=Avena sativa TaxID=4498 RepID=A0ACD5X664_AVESA